LETTFKYFIKKISGGSYFIRIALILLIGLIINIQAPSSAFSQEKPPKKTEKLKKPKGEKAKSNKRQLRETRYKTRNKKGDKPRKRDIAGKKIKKTQSSRPVRTYSPPNPYFGRKKMDEGRRAKPVRFKMQTLTKKGEQSTRKSITGRRLRPTTTSSRSRPKIYSAPDIYFGKRIIKEGQRAKSFRQRGAVTATNKIKEGQRAKSFRQRGAVTVSGKRNVYSSGKIAYRRSKVKEGSRAKSFNRSIRGAPSISRRGEVSDKLRRGVAPTISRAIRNRLPKNPFAIANTKRKRRGDKAWKNDITGRKYNTKISPRREIIVSLASPYYGKPFNKERTSARKNRQKPTFSQPKSTERLSKGQFGGVRTSTRRGERSSEKDIAGRKIRTKGIESRRPDYSRSVTNFNPYYGRKSRREVAASNKQQLRNMRSASKRGEQPYSNKIQLGSIRTSRRKGELSTNRDIAGRKLRTRSNISPRPSYTQVPTYSPYYDRGKMGDKQKIKSRRLISGGGSISGQLRNNKGIPLGGGANSVSYKLRNNKGIPLFSKPPGQGTLAGMNFGGRFKRGAKPLKGGGSVGIRLRNNKGISLGGGANSVSYKLRNNKGISLNLQDKVL